MGWGGGWGGWGGGWGWGVGGWGVGVLVHVVQADLYTINIQYVCDQRLIGGSERQPQEKVCVRCLITLVCLDETSLCASCMQ